MRARKVGVEWSEVRNHITTMKFYNLSLLPEPLSVVNFWLEYIYLGHHNLKTSYLVWRHSIVGNTKIYQSNSRVTYDISLLSWLFYKWAHYIQSDPGLMHLPFFIETTIIHPLDVDSNRTAAFCRDLFRVPAKYSFSENEIQKFLLFHYINVFLQFGHYLKVICLNCNFHSIVS